MAAEDVTDDPIQKLTYRIMNFHQRILDEEFEEMWGDSDQTSCGGWTYDPPCGGCYSCVHAQMLYGLPDYQLYRKLAKKILFQFAYGATELTIDIDAELAKLRGPE